MNDLNQLCKSYGVKSLYAFGSVVTTKFDEKKSDVDFLVELIKQKDPLVLGENMLNLWNGLEKAFNRPVDLLTLQSIKNPILKEEIEKTKVLIYEA